jgi:hypothetical protein
MSGWKEWQIAEVVEASDFQSYVQDQVVQVYTNSAARGSALGTAVSAGMLSYLSASTALEYYNGSAWAAVSNPGDITAVTAGTALTGGGSTGDVTLNVNLAAVGSAVLASPTVTGTAVLPSTTSIGSVSSTEIGYLDGVTSAIQTQINTKQAIVSGVSDTEIGYLDGVTSAIQTQINGRVSQTNGTVTTAAVGSVVVRNIAISTATPSGGMDGDVWLQYTP